MIVAILTSDWHLSDKPPVARSAEKSWHDAMRRPLMEIVQLQREHRCHVVVAGDVFDRYNPSPSLINFALENLPDKVLAVFGNHDLPLHNHAERKRSALWTLIAAKRVGLVSRKNHINIGDAILHGFGHGVEPAPCPPKTHTFIIDVAVVHAYCWRAGREHVGASPDDRTSTWRRKLPGYDVLHFGDNHGGFLSTKKEPKIVNPGTLMRRRIDEVDYRPWVGLLSNDGAVERHFLDCSLDKFVEADLLKIATANGIDAADFVTELEGLDRTTFDHREAVLSYLRKRKIKGATRRTVLEILEATA